MRDISTLPGQTFRSEVENGHFGIMKSNLVSIYGGTTTDEPLMVGGKAFWQGVVFNYYDAGSSGDGLVDDTGYNRKLAIVGSNMEFDSNGIPTSGNIEAIVFMNIHEEILVGVDQIENLSAADFHAAYTSSSTADDTAFINSLFDADEADNGADDAVEHGTGNADVFNGTSEDDEFYGKGGNDTVSGGRGDDSLHGGNGQDQLMGEAGSDSLQGAGGKDKLWGGAGSDSLNGGGGSDKLRGGTGKDELSGGGGKDKLWGNGGSDTLDGGAGNDMLFGGNGGDTFVFSSGTDVITDFNTGQAGELIDLSNASGIGSFDDLIANHAEDTNDGVLLTDNSGNSLLLEGVSMTDLQSDDFLF